MTFPETRHTLIQRIAFSNSEADWWQFLNDYWGPVCRFAASKGNLSWHDAEDVTSQTFTVLLSNRLLEKWTMQPTAKLRTLLCAVVKKVLSNRNRVEQNRQKNLQEQVARGDAASWLTDDATDVSIDAFYATWVDDLLLQAAESLMSDLHADGKGDYFRVLYGRICDDMPMKDVAESLNLTVTTAENYYKAARKRLASQLQDLLREQLARYSPIGELAESFEEEWRQLGEYLDQHGGIESALRRAYTPTLEGQDSLSRRSARIREILAQSFPPEDSSD